MQATKTLPEQYETDMIIDLNKNKTTVLVLNLIGAFIFIASGILFFYLALLLHPTSSKSEDFIIQGWQFLPFFAVLIIVFAFILILHEAIHGLCFWLFTRQRPRFGFKGLYAYAAAPEWYIPRGPFTVIGLAPLVVITLLGLALLPVFSLPLALIIAFAMTLNAAGAVGDLYIVSLLLSKPAHTLINDIGDKMTFYRPLAQPAS